MKSLMMNSGESVRNCDGTQQELTGLLLLVGSIISRFESLMPSIQSERKVARLDSS
ncbi:MAG: hypothetical protein R3C56_03690 [Pirellulaceae bacterium]